MQHDCIHFFIIRCSVVEAFVSVRRVAEFLRSPETAGPSAAQPGSMAGAEQPAMRVAGSFAWAAGASTNTSSGASGGRKRSGGVGAAAASGAAAEEQAGPVLQDLQLDVPSGMLVALTGSVGSGKSSLLSAMLGEMLPWGGPPKDAAAAAILPALPPGQPGAAEAAIGGCIAPGSSVAYVPQDPFILHGTLRWG